VLALVKVNVPFAISNGSPTPSVLLMLFTVTLALTCTLVLSGSESMIASSPAVGTPVALVPDVTKQVV
jgi:hypothetical protein